MDPTLVLDIIIVVLLVVGIIYAIMLDSQFSLLQETQRKLASMVDDFQKTSNQAQESLKELILAEKNVKKELILEIEKGFLIQHELKELYAQIESKAQNIVSNRSNADENFSHQTFSSQELSAVDYSTLSYDEKEIVSSLKEG